MFDASETTAGRHKQLAMRVCRAALFLAGVLSLALAQGDPRYSHVGDFTEEDAKELMGVYSDEVGAPPPAARPPLPPVAAAACCPHVACAARGPMASPCPP